ncbi:protein kinase domain-containing protein [Archangium sp.]|uniref:protein kinase domain-containing protein n=1 Tax=Archangium sp. TaxID=1872627 RepID=UPI00286C92A6|nr:protein kinase [Archangium sp.]
MRALPFTPPTVGDRVGEYRIVEVLGEGGFGIVYKVERAGLFFALKLFRARVLEGWGQREINILRHLAHPNVVRFHAYDRWPVPVYGYLYFIMDFVEGRTLEEWALDENPSARQVARILLELLRALATVHAQGVFHRDLKRDNVLIRDSDARPMLVDFGIGWLAGEPQVTRDTLPPITYEYRSPEALRFARNPAHENSPYRPDAGDDLWALGVTLYWLLTDVMPFGTRHEGGLNERILTRSPKAPREVNPRVPEALGDLCLRMLEKERAARFAGCAELCGTLEATLASAELDDGWDLPLMDPDAPDRAPTPMEPGLVPRDAEAREALQWNVARPQRGRKAAREAAPPPVSEAAAPAVWQPAPPASAGTVRPAAHMAAVVALVALASAGAFVLQGREASRSTPVPMTTETGAFLPEGWLTECPTPRACSVSELAAAPKPAEVGTSAVPLVAPPPASATAMLPRKQEPRSPPQDKQKRCKQWLCTAGVCGWVFVACTGPQVRPEPAPQVRPEPAPEDCPAGAVPTMEEELKIPVGKELAVGIPDARGGRYAYVRGGFGVVVLAAKYGELGKGTLLTGDFILGEKVVHGRFKQARTPEGKTYPVCMEFRQTGRGVDILARTGTDTVKVINVAMVRTVEGFE